MVDVVDEWGFAGSIVAPEEKYRVVGVRRDCADDSVGKLLPSYAVVATRFAPLYRECGVEQEHTLVGPTFKRRVAGCGFKKVVWLWYAGRR